MTPSVASEHEWVGVDACEAVMDAIFCKMCCNNTDYDYADARAKFDDLMGVFKAGHMRNVESMATHPGHREEFDNVGRASAVKLTTSTGRTVKLTVSAST